MFKKLAAMLAVLIIAVLAFATMQPDTMHVERSATMNARAESIFPLIADFHNWRAWSPYEVLDPSMTRNYTGAGSGKGAVYEWSGNGDAGQGRMEITDTSAPSHITIKLDFVKPFEGHNIAQFALVPQGNSTTVTWSMDGPNPYMAKLMNVFTSMDSMIGKDFETGLANMKSIAERQGG